MTFWNALIRGLRLRCPSCGQSELFLPWSFRMPHECPQCKLALESESGFYLGSIYINYGVTSLVILVTYVVMTLATHAPAGTKLAVCSVIAVILPILLFRHARSLWLAMDAYFDPSSQL
jgi:uncharacterized protein (DUF983 family)